MAAAERAGAEIFGCRPSDVIARYVRERDGGEVIHLGNKILRMRLDAGMTQAELAEKIGTKQSAVNRLEQMALEGHTTRELRKIAAVFSKVLVVDLKATAEQQVT